MVLDAYSGNHVQFHLMTLEYFQLVYSRLAENGVIVSNNLGSLDDNKDSSELYRAVYKTMSQVFPAVYAFPMFTMGSATNITQNIILVAIKNPDMKYYDQNDIMHYYTRIMVVLLTTRIIFLIQ
jgi:spermidine synthase